MDARILVGALCSKGQPDEIYEGAALGLACLPPIEANEIRRGVREVYGDLVRGRCWQRGRTRRLAVMALATRARHDPSLGWALGERLGRRVESANDGAALLYACGLTRDPSLVPALMDAARTGTVSRRNLHDVARSHAVLALAQSGDPAAVPILVKLLKSRKTGLHTRRGSALALGLMLRGDALPDEMRDGARTALAHGLEKGRDPLVRGFCAVSMGTALEPFGIDRLKAAIDDTGLGIARSFAALGLGLAAWRLDGRDPDGIRPLLAERLSTEHDTQLVAALSIAAGLAGSEESRDALFARLESKRLDPAVRGPAIQALGLLRKRTPRIEKTLIRALDEGSEEVVEDAALALGMLGTRSTALVLVDKLSRTRSESVQAHMVAALAHLGATNAVEPLLEIVEDKSLKPTIRKSAIIALGILLDDRDTDVLFEIDAHTNPYALTPASRSLVLPY
jgi:HEAT repeat protein